MRFVFPSHSSSSMHVHKHQHAFSPGTSEAEDWDEMVAENIY